MSGPVSTSGLGMSVNLIGLIKYITRTKRLRLWPA